MDDSIQIPQLPIDVNNSNNKNPNNLQVNTGNQPIEGDTQDIPFIYSPDFTPKIEILSSQIQDKFPEIPLDQETIVIEDNKNEIISERNETSEPPKEPETILTEEQSSIIHKTNADEIISLIQKSILIDEKIIEIITESNENPIIINQQSIDNSQSTENTIPVASPPKPAGCARIVRPNPSTEIKSITNTNETPKTRSKSPLNSNLRKSIDHQEDDSLSVTSLSSRKSITSQKSIGSSKPNTLSSTTKPTTSTPTTTLERKPSSNAIVKPATTMKSPSTTSNKTLPRSPSATNLTRTSSNNSMVQSSPVTTTTTPSSSRYMNTTQSSISRISSSNDVTKALPRTNSNINNISLIHKPVTTPNRSTTPTQLSSKSPSDVSRPLSRSQSNFNITNENKSRSTTPTLITSKSSNDLTKTLTRSSSNNNLSSANKSITSTSRSTTPTQPITKVTPLSSTPQSSTPRYLSPTAASRVNSTSRLSNSSTTSSLSGAKTIGSLTNRTPLKTTEASTKSSPPSVQSRSTTPTSIASKSRLSTGSAASVSSSTTVKTVPRTPVTTTTSSTSSTSTTPKQSSLTTPTARLNSSSFSISSSAVKTPISSSQKSVSKTPFKPTSESKPLKPSQVKDSRRISFESSTSAQTPSPSLKKASSIQHIPTPGSNRSISSNSLKKGTITPRQSTSNLASSSGILSKGIEDKIFSASIERLNSTSMDYQVIEGALSLSLDFHDPELDPLLSQPPVEVTVVTPDLKLIPEPQPEVIEPQTINSTLSERNDLEAIPAAIPITTPVTSFSRIARPEIKETPPSSTQRSSSSTPASRRNSIHTTTTPSQSYSAQRSTSTPPSTRVASATTTSEGPSPPKKALYPPPPAPVVLEVVPQNKVLRPSQVKEARRLSLSAQQSPTPPPTLTNESINETTINEASNEASNQTTTV